MSQKESEQLAEISRKLDQLIALLKIGSRKTLEEYKRQLQQDKVYLRILEITNSPLSYSDIVKRSHEELGVAEITVKKKIAELKAMGLLIAIRKGREVYYENSGILD
jgi:DNA-binding transcriptional ArsR family regulator